MAGQVLPKMIIMQLNSMKIWNKNNSKNKFTVVKNPNQNKNQSVKRTVRNQRKSMCRTRKFYHK